MAPTPSDEGITHSSGNVFVDLDVPYPETRLARAHISIALTKRMQDKDWEQTFPDHIDTIRAGLRVMPLETLLDMLRRLGGMVDVRWPHDR